MFWWTTKKKVIDVDNLLKICFTGHRPKGLPWGYDETKASCIHFKKVMFEIIEKAILNGYKYFICGMALGIDMICAEIVMQLKQKYKNIYLECAIPCKNQTENWRKDQIQRYTKILNQADFVHYVSDKDYTKNCMNERNAYMVDKCDAVIAVWNGKPSGTGNTVRMAKNKGKKIRIIDPKDPK